MFALSFNFFFVLNFVGAFDGCLWTPTTVSGSKKPVEICSGQLIFEDNFDNLNGTVWQHRVTLSGGRISE